MAPLYLRHPSSLEHETGMHPERADRIRAIEAALAARDWLGWEVREAPAATDEQLLRIHPHDHVERIRAACAHSQALDLDTPVVPGSWDAALHAAGGACALVDAVLSGDAPTGFAALRPPGHHAEPDRAMGFCLFSNVAIAARHALAAHGAERVLVLDWDVHHGNGTQAAFYDSDEVLFISLHRWPFYPGTGSAGENGSGAGEGLTLNLPQAAGSGAADWLAAIDDQALPAARAYRPDLILISAGYDAHREDPLGGCALTTRDFGSSRAASPISRRSWRRQPARFSRAATTFARSPSRSWRRWKGWPPSNALLAPAGSAGWDDCLVLHLAVFDE